MPIATKTETKKYTSIISPSAPLFSISIISEMIGVHQRTLRIYDEEGLLVPKRTSKNRRLYSMADVERGRFIQYLTRDLGINLSGVRIIFHLLSQLKIEPENYALHIQKVAKSLNISPEEQAEKRKQMSKRGRRPKNAK